jgi:NADP-dependent aldehyde dehydrogenase
LITRPIAVDGQLETTPEEVRQLVAQASTAAQGWAGATPGHRSAALEHVAAALEEAAGELLPLAEHETHLPAARLASELGRTTFQLRLLGDEARAGSYLDASVDLEDPAWTPAPRPDVRSINVPVGPAVVFAAGNFPFAFSVAGGDTASALVVGCPVLVKAHPGHLELSRATARVVQTALERAGAPTGTFALLVGDQAGRAALTHPAVKAGAFTGSLNGGRFLFDLAQSRPEPIPFYAEMGSLNPVVVTTAAATARLDEVLAGYAESFTLWQGQLCTKPGLLLLPRDAASDQDLRTALGSSSAAPLLSAATHAGFVRGLQQLRAHPCVTTVSADERATEPSPTPTLLATTVTALLEHPELLEEVFGPASLVAWYEDETQLLELFATLPGQLTATLQAIGNEPGLPDLLSGLAARAGRVIVNGWPTGVAVTHAMHHGGPYPATTSAAHTSVGTGSLRRFTRPVSYQGVPDHLLPPGLQDANPLRLSRRVDGAFREA